MANFNYTSSKKRRRSGTKSAFSIKQAALLSSIPVAAMIGGGFALAHYMSVERPDTLGCFDREDQHSAAIGVDYSMGAGLSAGHLRDIERSFENAYAAVPENGRIDVFTSAYDVSGSVAKPTFSMCKPAATPRELEALGAPAKNAAYQARVASEAQARFETMAQEVVRELSSAENAAKDSPILSMVQSISRYREFMGDNRSFTLITDGINNSVFRRFCTVAHNLLPFRTLKTQPRYRDIAPESFAGTDVTILLVEYSGSVGPYCTQNEIRQFWRDYFEGNSADKVTLNISRQGA